LSELSSPIKLKAYRLLILEDDLGLLEALKLDFEDRGYTVVALTSFKHGVLETAGPFEFAITDLRLGEENGLSAVQEIARLWPDCRTLVLTGYGSIATAVEAVKRGAHNYLTKPVSIEMLERALWTAESSDGDSGNALSLARHEREYIEYVLNQCAGNISKAAAWLGVHRQSLQRKLRKFSP
jgi:two-component system, response regulator RegA